MLKDKLQNIISGYRINEDDAAWLLGLEVKASAAPDLVNALENLFEHCVMIHKYCGTNNNVKAADEAIKQARAAIARARGEEIDLHRETLEEDARDIRIESEKGAKK